MVRKRSAGQLTPLELEIMKVLWESGAANVQSVQSRLAGNLAYTTVQTMLNVLHRKAKVKRTRKGRAFIYQPVVSREVARGQALRDIINRLFGGSAETLVMTLVKTHHLTPAKLAELNKLIEDSAQGESHP